MSKGFNWRIDDAEGGLKSLLVSTLLEAVPQFMGLGFRGVTCQRRIFLAPPPRTLNPIEPCPRLANCCNYEVHRSFGKDMGDVEP